MAARRDVSSAISVRTLVTAALIVLGDRRDRRIPRQHRQHRPGRAGGDRVRRRHPAARGRPASTSRSPSRWASSSSTSPSSRSSPLMVLLLVQPIVSEAQSLAANFPTYQKDFLNWFTGVEKQFHFNVDIGKQVSTRHRRHPEDPHRHRRDDLQHHRQLRPRAGRRLPLAGEQRPAQGVHRRPVSRSAPRAGHRHLPRDGIPHGRFPSRERDQQPRGGRGRRRRVRDHAASRTRSSSASSPGSPRRSRWSAASSA